MELQRLYDTDIESSVLGTLFDKSPDYIHEIKSTLPADAFYSDKNRRLYNMIIELADKGESPTSATLIAEYRKFDTNPPILFIADTFSKQFVSIMNMPQHIGILNDYYHRRLLQDIGSQLLRAGETTGSDVGMVIDETRQKLTEVLSGNSKKETTLIDALTELRNMAAENMCGSTPKRITLTGFPSLDENGGFPSPNLIVIAGESGMGKTAFSVSILAHMIAHGTKVAMYSLEMTKEEIASRILSSACRVSANRLLNMKMTDDEWQRMENGIGRMWEAADNLIFDDSSTQSLPAIINSIRRLHSRYGIKGVVIDYLQLLSRAGSTAPNQEQFIAKCARDLKNLAKELGIWIVALSQLSRPHETGNPVPTRDRLRDSGQILEAADIVMLVYRPELFGKDLSYPYPFANIETKGTAEIIVAKGRNIKMGAFICGFDAETTTYYPLTNLPNKGEEIQPNDTQMPF